jgi:transposase
MGKSPPPYPAEFRQEANRLVQSGGMSRRQLTRELDISTKTLRQWLKQATIDARVCHDGLTTEETDELRRLRREIKVLPEELEILRNAAAFFAKAIDSRC